MGNVRFGNPRAVRLELPDWLLPRFEPEFGPDLDDEVAALNREAPLDLRVNTLKADRATAIPRLFRLGSIRSDGRCAVDHPAGGRHQPRGQGDADVDQLNGSSRAYRTRAGKYAGKHLDT